VEIVFDSKNAKIEIDKVATAALGEQYKGADLKLKKNIALPSKLIEDLEKIKEELPEQTNIEKYIHQTEPTIFFFKKMLIEQLFTKVDLILEPKLLDENVKLKDKINNFFDNIMVTIEKFMKEDKDIKFADVVMAVKLWDNLMSHLIKPEKKK